MPAATGALLLAAAVALLCARAEAIGRLLRLLDFPDGGRKRHARPTPLVGGLALMPPLSAAAIVQAALLGGTEALAPTMAGLAFLLLGLADDRRPRPPAARLLACFALGALVLLAEPALALRRLDLGPLGALELGPLALPFTLLCLVGLVHALNLADGGNGLVLGLAALWLLLLLAHAPQALVPHLGLFLLAVLIVLPFNWQGRLFLGSGGSYALGAAIGLHMIQAHGQGGLDAPTVALWLSIPVADCLRLIGARLIAGRSPFEADLDHLHHRLQRLAPWPRALAAYLALAALPGVLALALPFAAPALLVVALLAYALVLDRTALPFPAPAPGLAEDPKPAWQRHRLDRIRMPVR